MSDNKTKKNILFIVTKSENGGAQRWVKEQIDILNSKFNTFIVTDEDGWLIQNSKHSSHMSDYRIRDLFSMPFLKRFASYVKENDIDLIVAGTANAGVYGRLVKLFINVPVIYVSHGWSSIYNGGSMRFIYTRVERLLSFISDSILCVSNSDLRRAKCGISINEQKLKLIVNKSLPLKRRDREFKRDRIKVVSVARFKHPKRQELLIKAVKDMELDLYLVGDGPTIEHCKTIASDNVHFLGEVDGFSDFYKYDLFTLISDSEGLPLSAVEAMSAGLPIVLSNVGGCVDLVDKNGVLVENSIEDIKRGLSEVIDNFESFSKKSIELYEKDYNLLRSKDIYINYYNSFIR